MKKLFTAAAALLFLLPAYSIPASAEKALPFELTPPQNVSVVYLNGNDSPNTCEIHYSQNPSMSEWSSKKNSDYEAAIATLNEMGYDDLWITAQIDWSMDTQDDWHYNKFWDTGGYDEEYRLRVGDWAYVNSSYSDELTMSEWIFRYMGNTDDPNDFIWNGYRDEGGDNYTGWKDVLKKDQYEVISGESGSYAKIDFTKHTIYTRVRFLVTVRDLESGKDTRQASEWSETAAVGKEAPAAEILKAGDIAAPVIKDLHYTQDTFNGYPVIGFRLEVDDTLAAQAAQASGTQGGVSLEVEAAVEGSDDWIVLQGDWVVKAGEMTAALQNLAEAKGKIKQDTPLMLRARYRCAQPEQEVFYSDYSVIQTFAAEAMEPGMAEQYYDSIPPDEIIGQGEKTPHRMLWLLLLLIAILIVTAVVIVIKKRKKQS